MEIEQDFDKKTIDDFMYSYIRTYAMRDLKLKQLESYKGNRPSWYITKDLINKEVRRLT